MIIVEVEQLGDNTFMLNIPGTGVQHKIELGNIMVETGGLNINGYVAMMLTQGYKEIRRKLAYKIKGDEWRKHYETFYKLFYLKVIGSDDNRVHVSYETY